jgi:hypothetical protein
VDYAASISFKDPSKALEPFQRDILFVSVLDSLRHRNTATGDATALTDTVLRDVSTCRDSDGTINRDKLVTLVATVLTRFDHAAGVHYRAFHPVNRSS